MKKIVLSLLLCFFIIPAMAQSPFKMIPGSFYADLGLTFFPDEGNLDLETQSRSVGISYMYELPIGDGGHFSFHFGVGYYNDNFFFKDNYVLASDGNQVVAIEFTDLVTNTKEVKKTKLTANYFDIPIEFRYKTNPGKNAFRVSVGAKAGVLFSNHTKVKFVDQFDNTRKLKDKGHYDLNRWRFGLIGRIGYGPVNFFGQFALNSLFDDNALSISNDGTTTNTTPFNGDDAPITVGITLSTF